MKIEQLCFENFNALKGKWKIDFTDPGLCSDGLFAITGSTGAGKTTILDAICVALYHETPRLGKLTTKNNELMTRHTSHCMAEVTFIAGGIRYRSYWGQRRAKNSATGNLQPPKSELVKLGSVHAENDNDQGEILTDKLDAKLKQIQAITGLDFARFTTSMMLAQGQFSAFLQANANDRAILLEELTGNGIYTQISIAAFERHKQEKQQIALLREKMDAIQCLTPEERQQLNQDITDADVLIAEQQKQIQVMLENIQWRKNIEQLEQKLVQAKQEQEKAKLALDDFQPYQQALNRHNTALPLQADLQRLQTLRNKLAEAQQRIDELQEQKQMAEQHHETAQIAVNCAQENAKQWQIQRNAQQQWIREKVVPKQTEIAGLCEKLDTNRQQQDEISPRLAALMTEQLQVKSRRNRVETLVSELQQKLAEYPFGAQLAEQWSELQPKLLRWEQCEQQKLTAYIHLAKLTPQLNDFSQQETQHHAEQQKLADKLAVIETEFTTQQSTTFAELINTEASSKPEEAIQPEKYIENRLEQLQQSILSLQEAEQHLQRSERQWQAIQHLSNKTQEQLKILAELHHRATQLDAVSSEKQQALQRAVKKVEQLQEAKTKLTANLDIASHRELLHEGEACPLCGSKAHELDAIDTQPDIQQALNDNQQALQQAKQQHEQCSADWQQFAGDQQQIALKIASADAQLVTLADQLHEQQKSSLSDLSALLVQTVMSAMEKPEGWQCAVESLKQLHFDALQEGELIDEQRIAVLQSWIRNVEEVIAQHLQQLPRLHQQVSQQKQATQSNQNVLIEYRTLAQQHVASCEAIARQQQSVRQELQRLQDRQAEIQQQQKDAQCRWQSLDDNSQQFADELSPMLTKLGMELPTNERINAFSEECAATLKRWNALNHDYVENRHELALIQQQLQQLQKDIGDLQERLAQLKLAASELAEIITTENQLFAQLFPFVDVNAFLLELDNRTAEAETDYRLQQQNAEIARAELHKIQLEWQTLNNNAQYFQEDIERSVANFLERRQELGFGSEMDVLESLLPETVAARYSAEQEELQQKVYDLRLAIQTHEQELALLSAEQKTDADLVELNERLQLQQQQVQDAQQMLGGLKAKAEADDQYLAQRAKEAEKIEQQLAEYHDWSLMNDMIGSADGAKFRNFAQGLTLEYLVRLANHRLLKLDGRYQLIRASEMTNQSMTATQDNLVLKIIDTWQADVIRDTKTLSGGESFLVSLALALALSDLVSHKTSIDCLFLDEGFGTLDPEALDMALHTLESLNQDGKLIGVISHVDAMKERIPNQIKVHKARGLGYSQLDAKFSVNGSDT